MPRPLLAAATLLLATGALAGCGSDAPRATTSTSAPDATPGTNQIKIEDFSFSPATATVEKGATIIVTNKDGVAHTLTADDGSFDTGKLSKGNKPITLDSTGTFTYHCEIHSYMKGSIVVTG